MNTVSEHHNTFNNLLITRYNFKLNMEHFMRIAFWIFTLSVTLSSCRPIFIEDFNIKLMQNEVSCSSDSKFYTPQNVEPKCFKAALECFLAELQAVKLECIDKNDRIDQSKESLEHHLNSASASKDSTECVCETWPLTPFSTFLDKYETLLQSINAAEP